MSGSKLKCGQYTLWCKRYSAFEGRKDQRWKGRVCGCRRCGNTKVWKPAARLAEHNASHATTLEAEGRMIQPLLTKAIPGWKAKIDAKQKERELEQDAKMVSYFDAVNFAATEHIAMRKVQPMMDLLSRHDVPTPVG
ncbi:hypothetical protein Pmar_PMAR011541 [Perkinsus marinus ATCC 50983]|uniref:Uncharacterized protein n=1 Tax=Perkinsus marinus (strain ATCC 50983 / TXsc) TaxID=423536 RepID=C5LC33_PERM5|nr:hypothetical protein Pmar_PMAR011541 [Perkinsus marinus ATCC 50983]EER05516.1 hypothetical protein Pmar_PMAR011541 [Perkinsus marinus ATCC 50983]|eukprot:XP_002773700.1 hypothetical protein Pmar_PMAR011541 [Perkinsus marinus ATCC 50983]